MPQRPSAAWLPSRSAMSHTAREKVKLLNRVRLIRGRSKRWSARSRPNRLWRRAAAHCGCAQLRRPFNLKKLDPRDRVQTITRCGDTYRLATADRGTQEFCERNLRFKTDSSRHGPREATGARRRRHVRPAHEYLRTRSADSLSPSVRNNARREDGIGVIVQRMGLVRRLCSTPRRSRLTRPARPFRSARRRDCPIRSRSRRNCARPGSPADI